MDCETLLSEFSGKSQIYRSVIRQFALSQKHYPFRQLGFHLSSRLDEMVVALQS
jgi:hypothetical protein